MPMVIIMKKGTKMEIRMTQEEYQKLLEKTSHVSSNSDDGNKEALALELEESNN